MLFITNILITNITRIAEMQRDARQAQAARWAAQAAHDGIIRGSWAK